MDYAYFSIAKGRDLPRAPGIVYVEGWDTQASDNVYAYDLRQLGKVDKRDFRNWVRETWGAVNLVKVGGQWPNYYVRPR